MLKTILLLVASSAMASAATTATKHKAVKHAARPAVSSPAKTAKSRTARSSPKSKSKRVQYSTRSYQKAPTPQRYKEIQGALASKGYLQGEPNGTWGPESVDALKRFQTDQNLMPDGKIGALSLIALGLGPKRLSAQSNPQSNPPTQTDPPK